MMTFAVDEGAWVRKNVVFALSCDAGARGRLGYGVSLAFESGYSFGNQWLLFAALTL